jgi:hypothetical protein
MSILNRRYGPTPEDARDNYGYDDNACIGQCFGTRSATLTGEQAREVERNSMPVRESAWERFRGGRKQTHIEIKPSRQMAKEERAIAGMSRNLERITGAKVKSGGLGIVEDEIFFDFKSRHKTDAVTIARETGYQCEILTSKSLRVFR